MSISSIPKAAIFMPATLVLASFLAATGCASKQREPWSDARLHVIATNEKGQSVDPTLWPSKGPPTTMPKEGEAGLDGQIKTMLANMKQWHDAHAANGKPRKIMIFAHGGMVRPWDAIDGAADRVEAIKKAGYYPIFIVWNPELISSYGEHVCHVRRGEYSDDFEWLWPTYAFADIARAVARAPITWTIQAGNDINRIRGNFSAMWHRNPDRRWTDNPRFKYTWSLTKKLVDTYADDPEHTLHVSIGSAGTRENSGDRIRHTVTFFGFMPLRTVFSPLVDGLGSAAWDNMYRRVNIMYDGWTSANLRKTERSAVRLPAEGPLVTFAKAINDLDERAAPYEITLVGHSMGAIVMNELLRRTPDAPVKNIVYMAAACTVRDFEQVIVPYLQTHKQTNFYNLCLHPINDVRERHAADLPPRGSLLVWIDDMYNNPRTTFDRTLGRWENIVEAHYAIPREIYSRVNLKAFDVKRDDRLRIKWTNPNDLGTPQMHGDFSSCRFWDSRFWEVAPKEVARANVAPLAIKQEEANRQEQRTEKRTKK